MVQKPIFVRVQKKCVFYCVKLTGTICSRIDTQTSAGRPACRGLYSTQFALDNPVTLSFDLLTSGSAVNAKVLPWTICLTVADSSTRFLSEHGQIDRRRQTDTQSQTQLITLTTLPLRLVGNYRKAADDASLGPIDHVSALRSLALYCSHAHCQSSHGMLPSSVAVDQYSAHVAHTLTLNFDLEL